MVCLAVELEQFAAPILPFRRCVQPPSREGLGIANEHAGALCYPTTRERFWEVLMRFLATLLLAATLAVGIATVLVSPPASANYCGGNQCYGR
jgi:hypothetical protein